MKRDPITIQYVKGSIAQTLAEHLFRDLGFYVIPAGQEKTVNPIVQIQQLLKSQGVNGFKLERFRDKKGFDANARAYLSNLPDFVIISPKGVVDFLEVKFKKDGKIYTSDRETFELYEGNLMLIISLDCKKNFPDQDDDFTSTRFHIHFQEEPDEKTREEGKDYTIATVTLADWLKEEHEIENAKIISRYESYVDRVYSWMKNENSADVD